MRHLAILAVIAVLSSALGQGPLQAEERGPDLVTVIGAVGETNRPAFSELEDRFFAYHEMTFEKAFAFDRAALEALPQVTVSAYAEDWPAAVTASGPGLAEVLAAAGVDPAAVVTLFALDGYAAELSAEDRKAHDWVLAISADGTALGIGGRGPAWLLYDSGGAAVSMEEEAAWVWAVFLISAQ